MLASSEYDRKIRSQKRTVEKDTVPKVHSERANQGGAADHQIGG